MGSHKPDLTPSHILVVDDDPQFVGLISTWLRRANYQVTPAFSGEQALDTLERATETSLPLLSEPREPEVHPFDLVVLDVMMPGMRGTEVCRHIRANASTAQVPVLILTALSSPQERIKALEAGANDFITKPFQGVELLARVDNLVRWRRAELEAQAEIRQRNRELNALNQVASTLNQTLNLPDLLRQTLATVCHVTGFPWGAIHLLDHANHYLELAAFQDTPPNFLDDRRRIPRDDSSMWQVIEQMRPMANESITVTKLEDPASAGQTVVTCNCVLLAAKGQPVGLLTVGNDGQQALSAEAAQLLGAIGHQIGAAVVNASLFERLQRRSRRLDGINQITGLMMSRLDLPGVLSAIVDGLVEYWNAALARVWLCEASRRDCEASHEDAEQNEEKEELILHASAGPSTGLDGRWDRVLLNEETMLGRLAVRRREKLCVDPEQDEEMSEQDWVRREGLRCFAGYPLIHGDRLVGVLALFSQEMLHQSDFDLLRTFANQATVAIENARLYASEQQRVAELTTLTRELEHSQAQLVQSAKMAAAGRLAASLAHEINNPLQAIHNCLSLTQRFPLEAEEHTDFLKLAGEEVERLINIVQRILEFCRPSRGHRAPTDINGLIEHVVALTQKKLQHSDVELHLDLAPSLPPVHVVADQVSQVILNLIINAIEAMPDGGPLELASRQAGEWVEISVTDSGPGLNQEQIDHLFEPFFTTKAGGTGLGLAISFGIAERHGGAIHVTSTPGDGATFTARWPVVPDDVRST
jgi:signal transduction histidine kinase/DNA-binding response OmpR family regulator